MRVAILTQPLHTNYGGILQAFALQKVILDMGHKAVTERSSWQYNKRKCILRLIQRYMPAILRYYKPESLRYRISNPREWKQIQHYTDQFIKRNIKTIPPLKSKDCEKYDAFIVGSDQVWRPIYNPNLGHLFLSFIPEKWQGKRIAYAASFGTDVWELSEKQTEEARLCVEKFDLITIREFSGVELVNEHLHHKAFQVLDPTMLLLPKDYNRLCEDIVKPHGLFYYILDKDTEKEGSIELLVKALNIEAFQTFPEHKFEEDWDAKIEECIFPPVEEWLASFRDAKYVITDSFHGTVFSILFNRPFLTIVNAERGASRFSSLLSLFGLEDRLITPRESTKDRMLAPIDWSKVNKKLDELRIKSHEILKDALTI